MLFQSTRKTTASTHEQKVWQILKSFFLQRFHRIVSNFAVLKIYILTIRGFRENYYEHAKTITSSFRCYDNTNVNQTYFFFEKIILSLVDAWGSLPSSDSEVSAVQSWDCVLPKNQVEPPLLRSSLQSIHSKLLHKIFQQVPLMKCKFKLQPT